MSVQRYITSPKTHKRILVGGPTYQKLLKSDKYRDLVIASPESLSKRSPKKSPKKSKGCSNAEKYKNVPEDLFCGPEGGSCPGTFPVNTKRRSKAALAYARHAPNPEGIRQCVRRISAKKGW